MAEYRKNRELENGAPHKNLAILPHFRFMISSNVENILFNSHFAVILLPHS